MSEPSFTLLTDDELHRIHGEIENGHVIIPVDELDSTLGWERKPRGLRKGDQSIPVDEDLQEKENYIDLTVLLDRIGRPFAVDEEEAVGYVGTPAEQRAHQLESRQAPNFRLPDLDGNQHDLYDYRGRKIVLLAWASW